MPFRSLAVRTDLLVQRLYGQVEESEGCALLRTPTVPDYWYGNCLAMPRPPREGDYRAWMGQFERALPDAAHRVFLVDAPDGEVGATQAFVDQGFEINVSDVLSTRVPRRPERLASGCVYRPLEGNSDWAAAVALSLVVDQGRSGVDRAYLERKSAACRRAVEQGRGRWWGAWEDGCLVADLGLFWEGGLARFQSVETHPAHRRRGICRSLLHAACSLALVELETPTFVIVPADAEVQRVYEAVGFRAQEKAVDFLRRPL